MYRNFIRQSCNNDRTKQGQGRQLAHAVLESSTCGPSGGGQNSNKQTCNAETIPFEMDVTWSKVNVSESNSQTMLSSPYKHHLTTSLPFFTQLKFRSQLSSLMNCLDRIWMSLSVSAILLPSTDTKKKLHDLWVFTFLT